MAKAPKKVKSRYDEQYLLGIRQQRGDSYAAWKQRIANADRLGRGEFPSITTTGGGIVLREPAILNLADAMPRDVARLAAENRPAYTAPQLGDELADERNAALRGAIARTYFEANNWDILQANFVMDAVVTGAMAAAFWVDKAFSPYPLMMRLDPRTIYPEVYNGTVINMLVVTKMKATTAHYMFPSLDVRGRLERAEEDPDGDVEVWDYYAADEVVKCINVLDSGGGSIDATIVSSWNPQTDICPAAFWQVPSPDGAIRGLLDQIGGSLAAKDKAIKDMLEYNAQAVYSPFFEMGVLNSDVPPGPDVIYHGDTTSTVPPFMQRIQPAASSNQVMGLVQFMDSEQRGQIGYPSTRQGDVNVSQGSAAYVASTQGQLTSMVREALRGLTTIQQQAARIMFNLDKAHLKDPKPLVASIGNKKQYSPERDIKSNVVYVSYGAGAGIDRLQTDSRLLQYYSAGVIPAKRMLAETDFVDDPESWLNERQDEELERVALQRFGGDPNTSLDFLIQTLALKRDQGMDFVEAYLAVLEQQQQSSQAEAPAEGGMLSPDTQQPGSLEEMQRRLQSGEPTTGGAPPVPGQFQPQPIQQVFVKGAGNG